MIVGAYRNLELVNAPDAPLYKMRLDQCDQIELGSPDSMVQVGIVAPDSLRATNIRGVTVDFRQIGLDGLDTGTYQPNTEYWIHMITDGVTVRLIGSLNSVWPLVPPTYTRGALIGWTRSDANGHIYQMQKVDKRFAYVRANIPTVKTGVTPGASFVPVDITKYVSAQAARVHFSYGGGTAGAIVAVAASPAETLAADYFSQAQGWSANYSLSGTRMLEGGFLYYASNDPAGFLKITGFDDVF